MLNVLVKTDTRYPVNRKIIRKAVLDTLNKNKAQRMVCEVSVFVVGERKMDELTNLYLKDGKSHEVLSFPLDDNSSKGVGFVIPPDGILRLGDIVLCWPQVVLAAGRDEVMVDEEIYLLTSHSVEHLLGKHHD